jgi:hypothetical protein
MAPKSVGRIIATLIAGDDLIVAQVMSSAADPKKRSRRSRVRDWLYTRNVLTSIARTGTLADRQSVQSMLAERAPTAQQVIEARNNGELSPEQTNELLHYVLSPAEIAAFESKSETTLPPAASKVRAPRIRSMPQ